MKKSIIDNLLPADRYASMVSCIVVPEGMHFLGVMPILCLICGTDNAESVITFLESLDSRTKTHISVVVESTILSPNYPLSDTIWSFNDPDCDILAFKEALSSKVDAFTDLISNIRIHSTTFPFIETNIPLEDIDVVEFELKSTQDVSVLDIQDEVADFKPTSLIIPVAAFGSLMLLSSKLRNI